MNNSQHILLNNIKNWINLLVSPIFFLTFANEKTKIIKPFIYFE